MLHKRSSSGMRKVSPPQPTCMSEERKASYLADLRNNRPTRPAGSRPLPGRPQASLIEHDLPPRAGSALSMRRHFETLAQDEKEPHSTLSKRASMPLSNTITSSASAKGRPLVPTPKPTMTSRHRRVSPSLSIDSEQMQYQESRVREFERHEAHELREALEKIDQKDEERRIHDAAKLEAADLVWQHMNPQLAETEKIAAYRNPDLSKKTYGSLSHRTTASVPNMRVSKDQTRTTSGESTSSQESKKSRLPWLRRRPKINQQDMNMLKQDTTKNGIGEDEITALPQPKARRVSSAGRKVSSGSSKGVFSNPGDQIYEESEFEATTPQPPKEELPLRNRSRNSLPRGSRPLPGKPTNYVERFQAARKTSAQSRNAGHSAAHILPDVQNEKGSEPQTPVPMAVEIRSEDIRAATSMKRKDRSPNLPTPTAVSDRTGRPIVSFDPHWRPSNNSPRNSEDRERSANEPVRPPVPTISIQEDSNKLSDGRPRQRRSDVFPPTMPSISVSSMPPVPTISFPDDEPEADSRTHPNVTTINIENDIVAPAIIVASAESPRSLPTNASRSTRPLPQPTSAGQPNATTTHQNTKSRAPWLHRTPVAAAGSTVSCTACGLAIAGRIVTAAGSATGSQKARFHPECFSCHHCNTPLECVSFYPEPEKSRLERFQSTLSHLPPDDEQIQALVQSNQDLHFFCHLDFHEMYSPRCHSCKTPVEGAVILALGRHYHPDHFFCAECGDPFNQDSPFVEHNNYAYCVSCHSKRTSARCRACKKQILDEMTIEALGGKWHDECFVCYECGGDFGDEGRFFVREVDVELTEKEKRKGFGRKIEERAVCQGCEEVRIKNVDVFV